MFEQLVESSSGKQQGRRWSYFAATSAVWVLVTTAVIVAGVAGYDGRLNDQLKMLGLVLPAPPLAPPPPTGPKPVTPPKGAEQQPAAFTAQPQAPHTIPQPSNLPPVDLSVVEGTGGGPVVPGGDRNGGPDGGIGILGAPQSDTAITEPPPPPPTPRREEPPPVRAAVRRSGGVFQGSAIKRVSPMYPPLARAARLMGAVVVEVVVDESGNVISARALSGHALLREAAVAAARQWKWKPTLLTGVPVQVVGTITFNFTL